MDESPIGGCGWNVWGPLLVGDRLWRIVVVEDNDSFA